MPEILGRLRTPRLAAAPASPAQGELYFDTATSKLYWWDGTAWVDATGGGAELVYNGEYPAATPYTDGDIVIYNGVAYLCVRPTSAAPVPWAGTAGPRYRGVFTTVTWPPSSPVDGDTADLQADASAGVLWRFRYNAGSASVYKWEFVGGPPLFARVDTNESATTTGSWLDLATVGPLVVLPRGGDYLAQAGATMTHTAQSQFYAGIAVGAAEPLSSAEAMILVGQVISMPVMARATSVASGADLRLRYNNQTVGTLVARYRWISVQPVRIA
jgi:hypothetical protein